MSLARTELLVGREGMARLRNACVAVYGLGGVGSHAFEALARAGVGSFLLVDFDEVHPTNINRQLLALHSTVGRKKTELAVERLAQINPDAHVETVDEFLSSRNLDRLLPDSVTHAIDAIDALGPKAALLAALHQRPIPFVACMGASSRLSPTNIRVGDLVDIRHDPLAKRVRTRLRKYGIEHGIRCVYSDEPPQKVFDRDEPPEPAPPGANRPRVSPVRGTISYLPGLIGLTAAGLIVTDILSQE